jgi:hypothetical protein
MAKQKESWEFMNDISSLIDSYRRKQASDPKQLILPLEYRQALKLQAEASLLYGGDVVKYCNIPIFKKEESIIL